MAYPKTVSVSKDFRTVGSSEAGQNRTRYRIWGLYRRGHSVNAVKVRYSHQELTPSRLLDHKAQTAYYNKIVNRYMLFCSRYSKSLDDAFASLRIQDQGTASDDINQEGSKVGKPARQPDPSWESGWHSTSNSNATALPGAESSSELAIILLALRKLREALLASGAMKTMTEFCQRVYVFNVRIAVLAFHPASYHPALTYLLSSLHTAQHPLPTSELAEMTSYSILDLACRQEDLASAFALRARSCERFGYATANIDRILTSLVTSNWLLFWKSTEES